MLVIGDINLALSEPRIQKRCPHLSATVDCLQKQKSGITGTKMKLKNQPSKMKKSCQSCPRKNASVSGGGTQG